MKVDRPGHIFIVGAPRSGTKFLMNTLNRHHLINISPETHYFSSLIHNGFIKEAKKIGDLNNDANIKALVSKMFSQQIFGTFWKEPPVSREKIESKFLESDRTFKSLFDILLQENCREMQKKIPGEKTPSHVFHVNTLLEWFPHAKIIQIIRDPRAVLSSEINKESKPDYPLRKGNPFYNAGLFVVILTEWYLCVRKDKAYKKKYPAQYLSIRYEDLLNNHSETVQEVCEFLKVDFSPVMLAPPRVDSSYANTKSKEYPGPEAWRSHLPRWMVFFTNFILKSEMRDLGYA